MDTIGGFRLVRRLGSGDRAEVHLAQSVNETDGAPPRTAAVKVFRATTSFESIDDEIDSLARLSSPFLLRLHDLAIGDDGRPVLILGRLGPMTCSKLILQRAHLTAGEAVTILAPLVDAVSELAGVGVVHGRLRLDRIGFDDIGAPVLMGFGHARSLGPMPDDRAGSDGSAGDSRAWAEDHPDLVGEAVDLAAVTRSVLDATRHSAARSDLLGWLTVPVEAPAAFRTELRERLFELADPESVSLTTVAPRPIGSTNLTDRSKPVSASSTPDDLADPIPDWLAALHLPAWVLEVIPRRSDASARHLAGDLVRSLRTFLAPVRRPVWVAAGSVAILLVATLVGAGVGGVPDARADSAPRDTTASAETGPSSSSVDPSGEPSVIDSAEPDVDAEKPGTTFDEAAVTGDDPVAAATALLRARDGCIRRLSVLCLDRVDQVGGAAIEADSALIRALQEGRTDVGQVDPVAAVPSVSQYLGGTVIMSLAFPSSDAHPDPLPASLLLVRGEEGWRIRDLVVG